MKRVAAVILSLCLSACLSGCQLFHMEPQERLSFLNGIVENVGRAQLTEDRNLIGERTAYADNLYTGEYRADCRRANGQDVVFGGTSLLEQKLVLKGRIRTTSGRAEIRIHMNGDVVQPSIGEDGSFHMELDFQGGGNYIMVSYDQFEGTVEMTAAYAADAPQ